MALKDIECYKNLQGNDKISTTLDSVFRHSPLTMHEIEGYQTSLGGKKVSKAELVKELYHAITNDLLLPWQEDRLSALSKFSPIRLTSDLVFKCFDRMADETLSNRTRSNLMSCVFHTEEGQTFFEHIDPILRVNLSNNWVRPMVVLAKHETFPRMALAELVSATPTDEAKKALLAIIEVHRTIYELSFEDVYGLYIDNVKDISIEIIEVLNNYKLANITDRNIQ